MDGLPKLLILFSDFFLLWSPCFTLGDCDIGVIDWTGWRFHSYFWYLSRLKHLAFLVIDIIGSIMSHIGFYIAHWSRRSGMHRFPIFHFYCSISLCLLIFILIVKCTKFINILNSKYKDISLIILLIFVGVRNMWNLMHWGY